MPRPSFAITGASGLIGGALLPALRQRAGDAELLALGRVAARSPQGLRHVALDLEAAVALPRGIDTLVHLAGEKRDASRMWAVNCEGTRRLVAAAAAAGVRRFVHLSSVGVYGASIHTPLVTPASPRSPDNAYERSKAAAEDAVRELCPALGLEHVILQPSTVIADVPGRSESLRGLAQGIMRGRFAFVGQRPAVVNYVGVDDTAAAIAAAAVAAPSGGVYIINTPARLDELVAWVCDELGVAPPQRRIPLPVAKVVAAFGTAWHGLTGRRFPLDGPRLFELTNTTRYAGDDLHAAIGFDYPLGIERAVRSLIAGYRLGGRL